MARDSNGHAIINGDRVWLCCRVQSVYPDQGGDNTGNAQLTLQTLGKEQNTGQCLTLQMSSKDVTLANPQMPEDAALALPEGRWQGQGHLQTDPGGVIADR